MKDGENFYYSIRSIAITIESLSIKITWLLLLSKNISGFCLKENSCASQHNVIDTDKTNDRNNFFINIYNFIKISNCCQIKRIKLAETIVSYILKYLKQVN